MAKFYGEVGFVEQAVEKPFGVTEDVVKELRHYGDILRSSVQVAEGEVAQTDISLGNRISIMAHAYSWEHINDIRYVTWRGKRWAVSSIEESAPRIILSLGEVYNGPIPAPEASPED